MYTCRAQQLKGKWTKIKDTGTAPQAHGSVLVLASRSLSIPKLLEVNLWPAISLWLISYHLFIQQVCIRACVTTEIETEREVVMVWWDKVIRTLLRASLWVIQSLTGTAMVVINTLNYQGRNVCLCVCLHECAFPIWMVVCLIMSDNYQ